MSDKKLNQKTLKSLIHYDPATGICTRLTGFLAGKRAGHIQAPERKYRKISFGAFNYVDYEHRLIWLYMTGNYPPDGMVLDHIDGDGLNNRFHNIRLVERCQNAWNTKLSVRNTSGRTGVYRCPRTGRWGARMMTRGVVRYFGTYDLYEMAVCVREWAELKFRGAINHRLDSVSSFGIASD